MEPLRATCTTKVKANSVKQEFEKQDELKRSALRAVAALLHIPDSGKHYSHVFIKFMQGLSKYLLTFCCSACYAMQVKLNFFVTKARPFYLLDYVAQRSEK